MMFELHLLDRQIVKQKNKILEVWILQQRKNNYKLNLERRVPICCRVWLILPSI